MLITVLVMWPNCCWIKQERRDVSSKCHTFITYKCINVCMYLIILNVLCTRRQNMYMILRI
jgi:hypothetical protein